MCICQDPGTGVTLGGPLAFAHKSVTLSQWIVAESCSLPFGDRVTVQIV
jgi:hypothetical protein